jgi:hypothetical protein
VLACVRTCSLSYCAPQDVLHSRVCWPAFDLQPQLWALQDELQLPTQAQACVGVIRRQAGIGCQGQSVLFGNCEF